MKGTIREILKLRGYCDVCGFAAILVSRRGMITAEDVTSVEVPGSDVIPDRRVCLTCNAAPSGVKSENQMHKRLPDAEYQRDRK